MAKLESRIHGGKHSDGKKCGCQLWDRESGYTRPGSTSGRK